MANKGFEKAIESGTGMSIDYLRNTPLDELRASIERQLNKPLPIVSVFPWAGRGNVLRDRMISRKELDDSLDDALRKL